MFSKVKLQDKVFRHATSVTLLMAMLFAISNVSHAATPSPWKFDYSGRNGVTLSYQGIPVILKSTLQVTTPDWKKTFYVPSSEKQDVQKQTDGSWHITGQNDYFSAQYDLRPIDAQTFELHFKGELLKNVEAHIEYTAGYFYADPLANRPFSAKIGATDKVPAHTINGIVPAYPANENIFANDLAPGFQNLEIDSRLGKMTLNVDSSSPMVFGDARRSHFTKDGAFFWCGWKADNAHLLQVGKPVELTMTIHIAPNATGTPKDISVQPTITAVADAYVPIQKPVQIVPKPKQMQLNESQHFALIDSTKWSVTAPAGETRLIAAAQNLLGNDWKLKLPAPQVNKSTFKEWSGIRLGDDKPISFPADLANAAWANHPGAYQLTVDKSGVQIIAPTAQGAFYGIQTLAQLLRVGGNAVDVPFVQIEDWPTLQFRGALLHPSNVDVPEMKKMIELMARYKYNYAVISCENLQWESQPKIVWSLAISKKDLQSLVDLCRANFLEPIPLTNGPGHASWLIRNGENLDLAEDPKNPVAYSVNNPKTFKVVHELMSEVIDIFHPKIFHIGDDEVNRGRFPNPENPYNSKDDTVTSLILKNVNTQRDWLAQRGIKTMMWGDMFLNREEGIHAANASSVAVAQKARADIPKDVIVADWQYNDSETYPSLNLFQKEGLTTVVTPWYSPLDVRNFTRTAIDNQAWGMLQSTWYSAARNISAVGRHPEDFSAFILGADYSWSGRSELPDDLPYDAATRLTHFLVPPSHTQHSGDLIDLDAAAQVPAESWVGLGKGWNIADFFADQKGAATRRFDGIDFRIPDHRFVALSAITGIMSPEGALGKLTLDIDKKANEIAFLHTALWNVPNGAIAARCTVNYTDGTHSDIDFQTGTNITPWQGDAGVANAVSVWKGKTPSDEPTNLHLYRWANPHPEKVIASLQLQAVDVQAGYALAGITLIQ